MSDTPIEVIRIRRDDRPESDYTVRHRFHGWAYDASMTVFHGALSPDVAESLRWPHIMYGSVHGGDDWRARIGRVLGAVEEDVSATLDWVVRDLTAHELLASHGADPLSEGLSSAKELEVYKNELRKVRSEHSDQASRERSSKGDAARYIDESIALAHPIAFRLLVWLHIEQEVSLEAAFGVFGDSASTFEGVARLHFLGALKYDEGRLTATSLGAKILERFGFFDDVEHVQERGPST